MFEKEVLERDVLNRIRWDSSLDPADFSIAYLDLGRLRMVAFPEIELESNFFRVADSLVPMHRIRKVFFKEKVVWDKRRV